MIVYADELFLINFISAYIMLYLLGKYIIKKRVIWYRLIIAAALGAGTAVIIFTVQLPFAVSVILRVISVFIMIYAAYFEKRSNIAWQMLWFAVLSVMLTAAMISAVMLTGKRINMLAKAGIIYFDLPGRIFIPLLILSYIAVTVLMKLWQRRKTRRLYMIAVSYGGRSASVTALYDSGNLLKEPITGKCVSILEWSEASRLFEAQYPFSEIGYHAEELKLWAVPYNSIGRSSGILFAFIADSISIPEEKKIIENTFIGIYGEKLSGNNEYTALLNAELL